MYSSVQIVGCSVSLLSCGAVWGAQATKNIAKIVSMIFFILISSLLFGLIRPFI
jgi:hypothetical protein